MDCAYTKSAGFSGKWIRMALSKNLTPRRPKTRIAVDFLPCSGALCTEEGEISDKVIGS